MRYRIGEYFVAALLVAFASLRDARLSELLFPTARVLHPTAGLMLQVPIYVMIRLRIP